MRCSHPDEHGQTLTRRPPSGQPGDDRLADIDGQRQPVTQGGQRTGAFRFGDTRGMALTGALCATVHSVTGFTNQSFRGLVAGLLRADFNPKPTTCAASASTAFSHSHLAHQHLHPDTPKGQRVRMLRQNKRPVPRAASRSRPNHPHPSAPPRPDHHRLWVPGCRGPSPSPVAPAAAARRRKTRRPIVC